MAEQPHQTWRRFRFEAGPAVLGPWSAPPPWTRTSSPLEAGLAWIGEARSRHDAVVWSTRRLPELILVLTIAAAGVGLLLDTELPLGFALAGIALMAAWWRFKLPLP